MALKDLVRKGRPPKAKRAPGIAPIQVDDSTWFYPLRNGMNVVHEIRDRDGYIRTDAFLIKWVDVRTGLDRHQQRRKAERAGEIESEC